MYTPYFVLERSIVVYYRIRITHRSLNTGGLADPSNNILFKMAISGHCHLDYMDVTNILTIASDHRRPGD